MYQLWISGRMKKTRKVLLIIILVTIAVIWGQSMLNMEDSSTESSWVMNLVTPMLEIFVGRGNVTEFIVRKIAHFTEYFVLGFELELYLKRKWLLAAGVGFVVAFMDETIQMFSGRGPLISDVWLDFFGCITAVAVVGCVMWGIKKWSAKISS